MENLTIAQVFSLFFAAAAVSLQFLPIHTSQPSNSPSSHTLLLISTLNSSTFDTSSYPLHIN